MCGFEVLVLLHAVKEVEVTGQSASVDHWHTYMLHGYFAAKQPACLGWEHTPLLAVVVDGDLVLARGRLNDVLQRARLQRAVVGQQLHAEHNA